MKMINKGNVKQLAIVLMAIIVAVVISTIKFRSGDINYINSDATWHTLLTIEAYNETSASIHKFLPIVTLGKTDNKGVSWGATIPDVYGNYYYTSFSPAGFFAPWLFMRIFQLAPTEANLYLFNTLLFAIYAALWAWIICIVFRDSRYRFFLAALGIVTATLSPELLHGMGIVYWHQSLMMVTFLIQLLAYIYISAEKRKRKSFSMLWHY